MNAPRNPNAVTGLWPPALTTTCPLCGRTVSVLAIEPDGACERCHTAEPPPDHLGLPHDTELVVDGDVHDLAAHPLDDEARWDEADRLLERVCRRPTILPRATPEATHYARAMVGGLRQLGRPNTSCATCGSLLIHGRTRGGELLAQCGCTLATRAS